MESLYHCMAEMDLQVVMQVQKAIGLLNVSEVRSSGMIV